MTDLDKAIFSYASVQQDVQKENMLLRQTLEQLKKELELFKAPALMVAEVKDIIKHNAVIKIPNGTEFFVNKSSECGDLTPGDMVLAEQKNLTIIKKVEVSKKFNVEKFVIVDHPNISWKEIGGLKEQIEEIKEVVEMPLKKPELFEKIGISPPKGVLLYGPPGTGKTLLAKGVASSTKSTFIEVSGSELVQKFIGEGAKLVKEIFEMARRKAPTIVFIDEIDALAATRLETGTSGEREVNRTFMQLLAELDGFKPLGSVKIIAATNRKDILDHAIVRPGRLDRLLYVPNPSGMGIDEVLKIHTKKMKFVKKFGMNEIAKKLEGFSGAEIKAVCTEAGYFAIRENREKIKKDDFLNAIEKVKQTEEREGTDYLNMFG